MRAVSSRTILPSGVSFCGALNSGGYTRKAPNSGLFLASDRSGSTCVKPSHPPHGNDSYIPVVAGVGRGMGWAGEGAYHDGEPGVAPGVHVALPGQLGRHVGGREEAVAVHLHVERVAVVPAQEPLLTRLHAQTHHTIIINRVARARTTYGQCSRTRGGIDSPARGSPTG
jgi:hypothetical protein